MTTELLKQCDELQKKKMDIENKTKELEIIIREKKKAEDWDFHAFYRI